ncbi:FAD-dependent monooxygenase [Alteromonas oceanisediminis]|uniref:FAD-dependent monooxygenase n=1 Tax=Alteromonas oceanisediminis TaxID=2836180 RepID=UPI001BD94102|nr:FAD-dependent monooxygenase [Alteromonas oceanisediminis]MBT0585564.1 FAD-dependent monooxygenase [Alteromonas oceanisediminis]
MGEVAECDIAIVGGGTVGLTLALGMMTFTSLKVAVIDPQLLRSGAESDLEHNTPQFDARCLALAGHSVDFLAALDVSVKQLSACDIHDIQVSDAGFIGKTYLRAGQLNMARLGIVTPISHLNQALASRFSQWRDEQPDRLIVFAPDSVEAARQHQSQVCLTLSSGKQLSCRCVAVADGGRSPLSQALGFSFSSTDYAQTAIIANVSCEQPHANQAFERFTQHGPLALLPLAADLSPAHSGGLYSLVWTLDQHATEFVQRLQEDDAFFLASLHELVGAHHGRFTTVSERHVYPLQLNCAERVIAHRSVLFGNAAQTLHPIAGQGFNLGLRDVYDWVMQCQATEQASLAHTDDSIDIGEWRHLQAYQARRADDRSAVISATDTLVHTFSNHHWPLVMGRNAALVLLDHIPMIKRQMARRAMGYRERAQPLQGDL